MITKKHTDLEISNAPASPASLEKLPLKKEIHFHIAQSALKHESLAQLVTQVSTYY